jgi:uncharacterized protein with beta-barrel porin domain
MTAQFMEYVWASVNVSGSNLKDNDDEFKTNSFGAQAGGKLFENETLTAGAFIGIERKTFKQGQDEANATDLSFGAYGAWYAKKINVKANAGLGFQNVNAKNDANAKAEFGTFNIRFGAEAQYNLEKIKPFLSLQGGYVSSPDIDEKADGETIAIVEADRYLRLTTLLGVKIENTNESKLSWNAKGYLGTLLSGAKPEYKVKPEAQGATSYSLNATEESRIFIGLGAGIKYVLTQNISINLGVDLNFAAGYSAYLGSLGASYKF